MNSSAVGLALDRRDGFAKVTGAARYAAEWPLENIAHAVIKPSETAKGRLVSLDVSAAEKASGVIRILTHLNIPKMKKTLTHDKGGAEATEVDFLQTEEIFWNGQPLAVVVAETYEQASCAAGMVRAECHPQPPKVTLESGKAQAFTPEKIMKEPPEVRIGDAETALKNAPVKVDQRYHTPPENHNAIEPHAVIAHWEAADRLTVYDASQHLKGTRKLLAEKFSVPLENVRVLSPLVGGGFGGKGVSWPHVALAVAAARAVGRPVKLALPRQQVYRMVGGRPETSQRVALGAEQDGTLTALIHTGLTATSTSNLQTEQFTFPARHLYKAVNILLAQQVTRLDVVPPTFMRAPGETPGMFALESALDELSYALKMDPVELRLRNDPEKDPTTGKPFSIRHFREVFTQGAEKFGWARRKQEPRSMRDGHCLAGYGTAAAYYPCYQMACAARVRLSADGTARGQSSVHEMGMGTATAQAQGLAERLGLPAEKVTFEIGDTNFPDGSIAGGSNTTLSTFAAVGAACEAVVEKLLTFVSQQPDSPLHAAKKEEVELRNGGIFHKKETARGESWAAILKRAGAEFLEAEGKAEPAEEEKFSRQSFGAHFCEVRVDEVFGTVRVKRFVSVFDTGRIVNAKTAASQFRGGIIMGLGMALMEETLIDSRQGRIMNPNLSEYHIPVHADVPHIEVHALNIPDPHTPLGVHGIGEIGITGVAAAVANAIYHATGKRIREVPITPDKLFSASQPGVS